MATNHDVEPNEHSSTTILATLKNRINALVEQEKKAIASCSTKNSSQTKDYSSTRGSSSSKTDQSGQTQNVHNETSQSRDRNRSRSRERNRARSRDRRRSRSRDRRRSRSKGRRRSRSKDRRRSRSRERRRSRSREDERSRSRDRRRSRSRERRRSRGRMDALNRVKSESPIDEVLDARDYYYEQFNELLNSMNWQEKFGIAPKFSDYKNFNGIVLEMDLNICVPFQTLYGRMPSFEDYIVFLERRQSRNWLELCGRNPKFEDYVVFAGHKGLPSWEGVVKVFGREPYFQEFMQYASLRFNKNWTKLGLRVPSFEDFMYYMIEIQSTDWQGTIGKTPGFTEYVVYLDKMSRDEWLSLSTGVPSFMSYVAFKTGLPPPGQKSSVVRAKKESPERRRSPSPRAKSRDKRMSRSRSPRQSNKRRRSRSWSRDAKIGGDSKQRQRSRSRSSSRTTNTTRTRYVSKSPEPTSVQQPRPRYGSRSPDRVPTRFGSATAAAPKADVKASDPLDILAFFRASEKKPKELDLADMAVLSTKKEPTPEPQPTVKKSLPFNTTGLTQQPVPSYSPSLTYPQTSKSQDSQPLGPKQASNVTPRSQQPKSQIEKELENFLTVISSQVAKVQETRPAWMDTKNSASNVTPQTQPNISIPDISNIASTISQQGASNTANLQYQEQRASVPVQNQGVAPPSKSALILAEMQRLLNKSSEVPHFTTVGAEIHEVPSAVTSQSYGVSTQSQQVPVSVPGVSGVQLPKTIPGLAYSIHTRPVEREASDIPGVPIASQQLQVPGAVPGLTYSQQTSRPMNTHPSQTPSYRSRPTAELNQCQHQPVPAPSSVTQSYLSGGVPTPVPTPSTVNQDQSYLSSGVPASRHTTPTTALNQHQSVPVPSTITHGQSYHSGGVPTSSQNAAAAQDAPDLASSQQEEDISAKLVEKLIANQNKVINPADNTLNSILSSIGLDLDKLKGVLMKQQQPKKPTQEEELKQMGIQQNSSFLDTGLGSTADVIPGLEPNILFREEEEKKPEEKPKAAIPGLAYLQASYDDEPSSESKGRSSDHSHRSRRDDDRRRDSDRSRRDSDRRRDDDRSKRDDDRKRRDDDRSRRDDDRKRRDDDRSRRDDEKSRRDDDRSRREEKSRITEGRSKSLYDECRSLQDSSDKKTSTASKEASEKERMLLQKISARVAGIGGPKKSEKDKTTKSEKNKATKSEKYNTSKPAVPQISLPTVQDSTVKAAFAEDPEDIFEMDEPEEPIVEPIKPKLALGKISIQLAKPKREEPKQQSEAMKAIVKKKKEEEEEAKRKAMEVKCDSCDKVLSNKQHLKRHKFDMHTTKTEVYRCYVCGYDALQDRWLIFHLKYKHDISEIAVPVEETKVKVPPFVVMPYCDVCKYGTFVEGIMQRHNCETLPRYERGMLVTENFSSAYNPSKADILNPKKPEKEELLSISELKSKIKQKVEALKTRKAKEKTEMKAKKEFVVDDGTPKCLKCLKKFSSDAELQRHEREVHEYKTTVYRCFDCGFDSVRFSTVQKHMLNCHERDDVLPEDYRVPVHAYQTIPQCVLCKYSTLILGGMAKHSCKALPSYDAKLLEKLSRSNKTSILTEMNKIKLQAEIKVKKRASPETDMFREDSPVRSRKRSPSPKNEGRRSPSPKRGRDNKYESNRQGYSNPKANRPFERKFHGGKGDIQKRDSFVRDYKHSVVSGAEPKESEVEKKEVYPKPFNPDVRLEVVVNKKVDKPKTKFFRCRECGHDEQNYPRLMQHIHKKHTVEDYGEVKYDEHLQLHEGYESIPKCSACSFSSLGLEHIEAHVCPGRQNLDVTAEESSNKKVATMEAPPTTEAQPNAVGLDSQNSQTAKDENDDKTDGDSDDDSSASDVSSELDDGTGGDDTTCPYCDEKLWSKRERKEHEHEMHEVKLKVYRCRVCSQDTAKFSSMQVHYKIKHIGKVVKKKLVKLQVPPYTTIPSCPSCSYASLDKQKFLEHACRSWKSDEGKSRKLNEKDIQGGFHTGLEAEKAASSGKAFKVIEVKDMIFRCEICSHDGLKYKQFKQHFHRKHRGSKRPKGNDCVIKMPTPTVMKYCKICEFSSINDDVYNNHECEDDGKSKRDSTSPIASDTNAIPMETAASVNPGQLPMQQMPPGAVVPGVGVPVPGFGAPPQGMYRPPMGPGFFVPGPPMGMMRPGPGFMPPQNPMMMAPGPLPHQVVLPPQDVDLRNAQERAMQIMGMQGRGPGYPPPRPF